jgi:hypothetical protein
MRVVRRQGGKLKYEEMEKGLFGKDSPTAKEQLGTKKFLVFNTISNLETLSRIEKAKMKEAEVKEWMEEYETILIDPLGLPECSIESILSKKSVKEISGVGEKDSTVMKTVNLTKTQIKTCQREMAAEIRKQKQEPPDEVNLPNGCGGICDDETVSDCEYTCIPIIVIIHMILT